MGSIRYRPRHEAVANQEDSTEWLRDHFFAHLESERVRFASLGAALSRAAENPGWIFDDLAVRAHRLFDGAAIIEVEEVAQAADALEQAAHMAAETHATNTDPSVRDALRTLLRVINSLQPIVN